ncbi:MAG: hypothetical protein EA378_09910 [Phycisphaerales bacterium]|nr:MAG: hypothetical protein EA378_09910 [Phycisphaerales bacterium]
MPERLRGALATIREQLGQMTATQKLLIGSLAVILVMTLFVVGQYAGRPAMVELLPGATAEEMSRAEVTLASAGISAESRQGRLMVTASDQHRAMVQLAANRALPADGEQILYTNLSERQSWQNSRRQNEQLFVIATQNELSRMIEKVRGVRRAEVQLDVPEANGIGRVVRTPTASVVVQPESGSGLSQGMVDAIAELVAWSRAGLDVRNVRVIDAATGRSRRPSDPDDIVPSTYIEHASRIETMTREKLLDLLGYIPGVQVAVTAQVDVTRVNRETRSYLPEGEGTLNLALRERNQSENQERRATSAEPGMRSNQSAEINTGGGSGTAYERADDEIEFNAFPGQQVERISDPRGMPTRVAVSINIPRSYVAELIAFTRPPAEAGEGEDGAPARAAGPTPEELEEAFAEVEPRIRQTVLPHVLAMSAGGGVTTAEEAAAQLAVAMVPLDFAVPGMTGSPGGLFGMIAGGGSGGGGDLGLGPGGLVSQVLVLGLAGFAVVMMLLMVRKASKRVDLPTAAELVGIPPTLETNTDLVGEAEEGDAPMTGIEVGDDDVRSSKMLDQVAEMVRNEPQVAAKLLNRWIQVDDY